jgi:methyl-accepting chemotaxis protein
MATKTGFRDLQRTSLLRDTRISTRLWVLIGVSLLGLVYFAITSGLRVRDQARLVEGGLSIRELANLSQQAASAVSDAKQNNGDSVEKMKAFTQWIAQSPLGPVASKPTTVAGRDFAEANDRLKATLQRAPGLETAIQSVAAAAEVVNASGALTRDVSLTRSLASHARTLVDADPSVVDRKAQDSAAGVSRTVQNVIDDCNAKNLVQNFLMLGVFAGLTFVVGYFTIRSVTRQITSITDLLTQIGIGNFAARAEVLSRDELGRVAQSLNAMLDNTLRLIQSEQERDAIQASIKKLLDEVSGVATGDLSVEAEVGTDFTGAIADSFNFMISQLREIVANVQEATQQVTTSASTIQQSTEQLSRGSEAQVSQIVQTSHSIDEIAKSIQMVAASTQQSATVASEARTSARRGTEMVHNTIGAMDRIRNQVQETSKRIKRLGESSQEIGEITQLIGDIADRTSILALNASIQAAMAGEAGQGFAVVAEEVERLAERANNATKQIETLVKTIQTDTNEAVSAMEESTREVVEGSKLAQQAGQTLNEIDNVSNRLAELIQTISSATKDQARGADALTRSMNEINAVTQQTAQGTKQAATSVSKLARLADALRVSVANFKLPSHSSASENSTLFRRMQTAGV